MTEWTIGPAGGALSARRCATIALSHIDGTFANERDLPAAKQPHHTGQLSSREEMKDKFNFDK